jgi:hypothetical protein
VFIGIISFPFLNDRFHFINDIESFENRRINQEPDFNIKKLDPFPEAFEKYYNDTFSLRNRAILIFNDYNALVFQKSPFPDKVIIGTNKWLYLAGKDIDLYLGRDRFTNDELKALCKELELKKKVVESRNCKFYVMITPGKAVVHPENIPFTYHRLNEQSWGEQLMEYMKTNSSINVIDLHTQLKEKAKSQTLYYRVDNHWNSLGAFYAANIAITEMSRDDKRLQPLNMSNYTLEKKVFKGGNIKQILGNPEYYHDTEVVFTPRVPLKATVAPSMNHPVPHWFPYPWEYEFENEIKNSTNPKLLIFSDSFGALIFPFLSENFSRTVKIFGGWSYIINEEIMDKEKPDVVLLVIHEPFIRNIFENLTKPK